MAGDGEAGAVWAFVSSPGRITAAVGDEMIEFVLAHRAPCLSETDTWRSAAESLRAWSRARLDPRLLRRHGLPVWCGPHRSRCSPEPCGRLDARQPR